MPPPKTPMPTPSWHIVTGEYPPAPGGVADYSRAVARGLAMAGDEVHVWAPPTNGAFATDPGVRTHPLARGFGPEGLRDLSRAFERHPRPRRMLVQYVAQGFGMRGLNLPFCAWIASLRNVEVFVMFHEVRLPPGPWRNWKWAVGRVMTGLMASLLTTRADRILVSIPGWLPLLSARALRRRGVTWLPVPSGLPTTVPTHAREDVRSRLAPQDGGSLIGHFGTYDRLMAPILTRTLLQVLNADPRRRVLLMGRHGDAFARTLEGDRSVSGRILATGGLEAADVAAHLAACDILVQPYPDGISTRRTSAMAGLALGLPIATNDGWLTEPLWRESHAVELAATPERLAEAVETLLADAGSAAAVGERGRLLYNRRFSLEHTIAALRGPAEYSHGERSP